MLQNQQRSDVSRRGFLRRAATLVAAGVGGSLLSSEAFAGDMKRPDDLGGYPLEAGYRYDLVRGVRLSPDATAANALQPDTIYAHCCPTGFQCVINGTITGWAARCTDACGTFFICRQNDDQNCFNLAEGGC